MQTWILLMMMWVPSTHASGAVTSAEFSSLVRCEDAAHEAEHKFNGFASTLYYVCVQK